jgi:hypothetical protein
MSDRGNMLATYYSYALGIAFGANTPGTSLTEQLVREHVQHARFWAERSRSRTSCDDAYGDLLLATMEFARARGMAEATSDFHRRLMLIGEVHRLMTELLGWSHELRVRCRHPLLTLPPPAIMPTQTVAGWR